MSHLTLMEGFFPAVAEQFRDRRPVTSRASHRCVSSGQLSHLASVTGACVCHMRLGGTDVVGRASGVRVMCACRARPLVQSSPPARTALANQAHGAGSAGTESGGPKRKLTMAEKLKLKMRAMFDTTVRRALCFDARYVLTRAVRRRQCW